MTPEEKKAYRHEYYLAHKDRYRAWSKAWLEKPGHAERMREWKKAWGQTERGKLSIRNHNLKQSYGMSVPEWDAMFEGQGRKCDMCGATKPRGGQWVIDHDHDTKKIRAIICTLCNTMLGAAWDTEAYLECGKRYKRRHSSACLEKDMPASWRAEERP